MTGLFFKRKPKYDVACYCSSWFWAKRSEVLVVAGPSPSPRNERSTLHDRTWGQPSGFCRAPCPQAHVWLARSPEGAGGSSQAPLCVCVGALQAPPRLSTSIARVGLNKDGKSTCS